jgi:hypothetical protein
MHRAVTVGVVAATVEIYHLSEAIIEKFSTCESLVDAISTVKNMTTLEQAGTITCLCVLFGFGIHAYQKVKHHLFKNGGSPHERTHTTDKNA